MREAFERTLRARRAGEDGREVADDWLFETAKRFHRAGEGASHSGLKPAGLIEDPVAPKVKRAIETGDPEKTIAFILRAVEDALRHRFRQVMETRAYDPADVAAGRRFIASFLGWVVYSHHLYTNVKDGDGHGEPRGKKIAGDSRSSPEHRVQHSNP